MNKEQIEKIIENLSKEGYHLVNKTINDDLIKLDFGDCKFTFNFKNEHLVIEVVTPLDYRMSFDQENVNFLNSITDYWEIYKHWITFNFIPKNEQELEATLKELLESYN